MDPAPFRLSEFDLDDEPVCREYPVPPEQVRNPLGLTFRYTRNGAVWFDHPGHGWCHEPEPHFSNRYATTAEVEAGYGPLLTEPPDPGPDPFCE